MHNDTSNELNNDKLQSQTTFYWHFNYNYTDIIREICRKGRMSPLGHAPHRYALWCHLATQVDVSHILYNGLWPLSPYSGLVETTVMKKMGVFFLRHNVHATLDNVAEFCGNWIRISGRKPCNKNLLMGGQTQWQWDLYNLCFRQINKQKCQTLMSLTTCTLLEKHTTAEARTESLRPYDVHHFKFVLQLK